VRVVGLLPDPRRSVVTAARWRRTPPFPLLPAGR
jgi:hypothetical protein